MLFAQACVLKCKHSPTEPQRSKTHACLYILLLLLLFHGSANLPDATGAAAAMAAEKEEERPYKPSLDWTAAALGIVRDYLGSNEMTQMVMPAKG